MSNPVKQRLMKGFAAQGFAQVVNVIIQVCNVPLFLHFWGKVLFGEWILLSTIPTYLAFSDFGFGSAASAEMALRVARDDKFGAVEVYQSVWLLITGISFFCMSCIMIAVHFLPVEKWFHLHLISKIQSQQIIALLILQVFVALQQGLLGAGFRSEGNYGRAITVANLQRLAEFLVGAWIVMRGGSPVALAAAVLVAGACSNALIRYDLSRRSPWITVGWRHANWMTVKSITGPAMAFVGFTIGQALSIQGVVTVIGLTMGPSALVAFSTTRTLTRFVWQLLMTIGNTVTMELTVALGAGKYDLARKLHRQACQASLWLSVWLGIALCGVGRLIYTSWTRGKVPYDAWLMRLLLFVVVTNLFWSTSCVVSMAINRHQRISVVYNLASAASLGCVFLLTPIWGLRGAAIALLLTDALMIGYVLRTSMSILQEDWAQFSTSLLREPLEHIARIIFRKGSIPANVSNPQL